VRFGSRERAGGDGTGRGPAEPRPRRRAGSRDATLGRNRNDVQEGSGGCGEGRRVDRTKGFGGPERRRVVACRQETTDRAGARRGSALRGAGRTVTSTSSRVETPDFEKKVHDNPPSLLLPPRLRSCLFPYLASA